MTEPYDFPSVIEAIQRNADASARLLVAAEALRDLQASTASSGGKAEIHFNAGGLGLWVAVTCCVVAMVVAVGALILFVNLDRKVDRAIDYQQANYRSAK